MRRANPACKRAARPAGDVKASDWSRVEEPVRGLLDGEVRVCKR